MQRYEHNVEEADSQVGSISISSHMGRQRRSRSTFGYSSNSYLEQSSVASWTSYSFYEVSECMESTLRVSRILTQTSVRLVQPQSSSAHCGGRSVRPQTARHAAEQRATSSELCWCIQDDIDARLPSGDVPVEFSTRGAGRDTKFDTHGVLVRSSYTSSSGMSPLLTLVQQIEPTT